MSSIKTLLSAAGILILGAAGCAQPGVIEQHTVDAGKKKDAGKPTKPVTTDEDESTADEDEDPPASSDEEDPPASSDEEDPPASSDEEDPPVASKDAGVAKDAGKEPTASTKDAGTKPDTGKLAACPSPYTCQDPAKSITDLGLDGKVTDADGKPLSYACANGMQEMCDPKDPKKSCPNFPNAFCAHVQIMGLVSADLYNCAQLCSP